MAKLPLAPAAALGLLSPSLHLLPRDLVLQPRGMASSMAPAPPAPTAVVAHNAPPETTAAVAPPATARTRREEEGAEERERPEAWSTAQTASSRRVPSRSRRGPCCLGRRRPSCVRAPPRASSAPRAPPRASSALRACAAANGKGRERESRDFFVGSIWNRFIGVKGSLVFSRS
jgi:hypothetical protein